MQKNQLVKVMVCYPLWPMTYRFISKHFLFRSLTKFFFLLLAVICNFHGTLNGYRACQ